MGWTWIGRGFLNWCIWLEFEDFFEDGIGSFRKGFGMGFRKYMMMGSGDSLRDVIDGEMCYFGLEETFSDLLRGFCMDSVGQGG